MAGIIYKAKALASFVHPTYGNTMYHTGMIRLLVETGSMPVQDLSYGAFTKSFYVPAYRLFVSSLSVLSNTDPIVTAALAIIAFGVVAITATYLLGREYGAGAGLFAALFFVLSPELTIYTIRPFPEVLGIPLLLLALYFVQKKSFGLAVLAAVLTTMAHQTTAVVLGAFLLVHAIVADRRSAAPLAACIAAYAMWQSFALNSLDIMAMQQIALKESGAITSMHIERIGAFALMFAPFALLRVAKEHKKYFVPVIFAAVTLALAKNEWLGIGIFTDRLFTFFALGMVLLAGIGLNEIMRLAGGHGWK